MKKPIQKRTLQTRAKLLSAATDIVQDSSYGALRTEEVVKRAGVAKGTFFAHFPDKDALMDHLIGARMDAILDGMEAAPPPTGVQAFAEAMMPLMQFLASERYVFDVTLRRSGAAARADIGPIAVTFERHWRLFSHWAAIGPFRRDVPAEMLGEGIQAFAIQAIALNFCALHNDMALQERMAAYLKAWLAPAA